MTIHWIEDDRKLPPCGNCNNSVLTGKIYRAFIFDFPHEIPELIKTGDLNLLVCPRCHHRGWIWPGTLVVDRVRERAVYTIFDDNEVGDQTYDDTWSLIEEDVVQPTIREKTAWVYNYQHIYELIFQTEKVFDLEVKSGLKFRNRLGIQDLKERAYQWIEDMKSIGGVVMTTHEATRPFLAELLGALDDTIESEPQKHVSDALIQLRDTISAKITSLDKQNPYQQRIPETQVASLPENIAKDAAFVINKPAEEVTKALRELAQLNLTEPAPNNVDSEIFHHYRTAANILNGLEYSKTSTQQDLHIKLLELVPSGFILVDGRKIPWREYLSYPTLSGSELFAAMDFELSQRRVSKFGSILTNFAAEIYKQHNDMIVGYVAAITISEFYDNLNEPEHSAKFLALACLMIDIKENVVLTIPGGWLRNFAISWQRLSRYFFQKRQISVSIMCAELSATHFATVNDIEGEIRSRVDSLQSKMELPDAVTESEILELNAYIEDKLVEIDKNDQMASCELECLMILAQYHLRKWPGHPNVLSLSMGFEIEGGEDKIQPEQLNKIPVFDPQVAPLGSINENETTTEDNAAGMVFLQEISFSDDFTYIAGVEISGIDWFSAMWELIGRSAELGENFWHSYYSVLIQMSSFIHKQLPLYFFKLMQKKAGELGFTNMPPHNLPLQLGLASAYLDSAKNLERNLEHDKDLNSLLDELETFLRQSSPFTNTFETKEDQSYNIDPEVTMIFAELLEASKRYTAAAEFFRQHAMCCEQQYAEAIDPKRRESLSQARETALYRVARALLKQYRLSEDSDVLVEALDAIESYRSRSALADGDLLCRTEQAGTATGYRAIQINELPDHLPKGCFVLVFALLFETDKNDGFWFSALITPYGEIVLPRFLDFDVIYEPVNNLSKQFEKSRSELIGARINDSKSIIMEQTVLLHKELENLGDILLPPNLVAYLENSKAKELIVVPESYLFSVPFPALRVTTNNIRKYLFDLSVQGLAVSVAPNLTLFLPAPEKKYPLINGLVGDQRELSIIVSNKPAWRENLTPLYGVKKKLKNSLHTNKVYCDEVKGIVDGFFDALLRSETVLFFGHGEISQTDGSILIADNGEITTKEVEAFSKSHKFQTKLLILCACSGVDPKIEHNSISKDICGVHVSLIRGGVKCVIGSTLPILAITGVNLVDILTRPSLQTLNVGSRLLAVYRAFVGDKNLSSPIFWGHIVGFGNTFTNEKEHE